MAEKIHYKYEDIILSTAFTPKLVSPKSKSFADAVIFPMFPSFLITVDLILNHSKLTRKVNQKICSRLCESFSKGSFWKQVNLDIVPYYLESDHTLVLQCYCRSFNEKLTEKFKTQLQHSAILKDCIDELQEVNFSLELISTRPILYDELVEHLNFLMTSNIFQLETMIPIVFSFYGIDSFLETIKYWENLCDSLSTTTTRSLMSLNMIKLLNNNMIESENFKAHFFKENKQFYNFASFFI